VRLRQERPLLCLTAGRRFKKNLKKKKKKQRYEKEFKRLGELLIILENRIIVFGYEAIV
jgi:hypothetical protein